MSEYIVDIDNIGSVESLYNDTMDLKSLGTASIERASDVVFDEFLQAWNVLPVGYSKEMLPACYFNFDTRELAIEFEVELLNQAREAEITDLLSKDGELLAYRVWILQKQRTPP